MRKALGILVRLETHWNFTSLLLNAVTYQHKEVKSSVVSFGDTELCTCNSNYNGYYMVFLQGEGQSISPGVSQMHKRMNFFL